MKIHLLHDIDDRNQKVLDDIHERLRIQTPPLLLFVVFVLIGLNSNLSGHTVKVYWVKITLVLPRKPV